MGIQGMRNGIRNHRVWIIILFALLVVSLLWAYSVGMFTGGKQQGGEVDMEALMASYDAAIVERRAALEADPDNFTNLKGLADVLSDYAYVLGTNEAADAEAVTAHYLEAAGLYEKAIEKRPEELNATGLSDLYASTGVAYYGARNVEKTEEYFAKGVEADPSNSNAVFAQMQYLIMNSRYEEGVALVEAFQDLVGEEHPGYATAEQYRVLMQGVLDKQAEDAANKTEGEAEAEAK